MTKSNFLKKVFLGDFRTKRVKNGPKMWFLKCFVKLFDFLREIIATKNLKVDLNDFIRKYLVMRFPGQKGPQWIENEVLWKVNDQKHSGFCIIYKLKIDQKGFFENNVFFFEVFGLKGARNVPKMRFFRCWLKLEHRTLNFWPKWVQSGPKMRSFKFCEKSMDGFCFSDIFAWGYISIKA